MTATANSVRSKLNEQHEIFFFFFFFFTIDTITNYHLLDWKRWSMHVTLSLNVNLLISTLLFTAVCVSPHRSG